MSSNRRSTALRRRAKPLADNTLARVAKGTMCYVVNSPKPFLVSINHADGTMRDGPVDEPLTTLTAKRGEALVTPFVSYAQQGGGNQKWRDDAYPWRVGDHLWVREAWRTPANWDDRSPAQLAVSCPEAGYERAWCPIHWEVDGTRANWGDWREHEAGRLRASMHLPRVFSRLTLVVTGVKVERLQDISEADAVAEGIEPVLDFMPYGNHWKRYRDGGWNGYVDNPIGSYASLWTEINGSGSWEANPWVVAPAFTVHKQNIDAMKEAA